MRSPHLKISALRVPCHRHAATYGAYSLLFNCSSFSYAEHALLLHWVFCHVQVDAALDENNQALVATLIKVHPVSATHALQMYHLSTQCITPACIFKLHARD